MSSQQSKRVVPFGKEEDSQGVEDETKASPCPLDIQEGADRDSGTTVTVSSLK